LALFHHFSVASNLGFDHVASLKYKVERLIQSIYLPYKEIINIIERLIQSIYLRTYGANHHSRLHLYIVRTHSSISIQDFHYDGVKVFEELPSHKESWSELAAHKRKVPSDMY